MAKPKVGQVWRWKTSIKDFVVITELMPRYVGRTLISHDVRYKKIESLDEESSAVIDSSHFRKLYEWVSG
jgi:hypothetical protein